MQAQTHTETARRTKLSLAHISKVFGGSRWPSLDAAKAIADARNMTIDELYDVLVKIRRDAKRSRK